MIEGPMEKGKEEGEANQQPDDPQQQKQNRSPIDAMSDTRGTTAALILGQFLGIHFRVCVFTGGGGGGGEGGGILEYV